MTGANTEQRLQAAEAELTKLRIKVAELDILVGVLLHADATAAADTKAVALDRIKKALPTMREASPRGRGEGRPRLRLVDGTGSVSGQDLDEGLRRVRAGRGEAR